VCSGAAERFGLAGVCAAAAVRAGLRGAAMLRGGLPRSSGTAWLRRSWARGQTQMMARLTQSVHANKVVDSLCFAGCSEMTGPAVGGREGRLGPALLTRSSAHVHAARCRAGACGHCLHVESGTGRYTTGSAVGVGLGESLSGKRNGLFQAYIPLLWKGR